jgi:hypothetical protein
MLLTLSYLGRRPLCNTAPCARPSGEYGADVCNGDPASGHARAKVLGLGSVNLFLLFGVVGNYRGAGRAEPERTRRPSLVRR